MLSILERRKNDVSPSTRRAWIEILFGRTRLPSHLVALHPEGVDRNHVGRQPASTSPRVALHPEGVDRNMFCPQPYHLPPKSPSTRRAWIEIRRSVIRAAQSACRPPPGGRG